MVAELLGSVGCVSRPGDMARPLVKLRNHDFGAFPMEEVALTETSRLEPPGDTPHVVAVGVAEASLSAVAAATRLIARIMCSLPVRLPGGTSNVSPEIWRPLI